MPTPTNNLTQSILRCIIVFGAFFLLTASAIHYLATTWAQAALTGDYWPFALWLSGYLTLALLIRLCVLAARGGH